jgi:hypothetical protein
MKKTFLLLALFLGFSHLANAQLKFPDDTSKIKEPPIKLLNLSHHTIEFISPSTSTFSILIESNGNIVDIDEVSLSLSEVHTIDMSALPNGNYRVLITDIISGIEYEYFYRKDDDFVTI